MAKRILIIEDEPEQIEMMRMRFEANGFEVISAPDGQSGVKKAMEACPDLIILDMIMPKLNGIEVCKKIKSCEQSKNIPVVIVSASGSKDLEEECRQAGADEVLRKPYDSRVLVERVKHFLGIV